MSENKNRNEINKGKESKLNGKNPPVTITRSAKQNGGLPPSQSSNSLNSDTMDVVDSNAIIGDYDMARSPSTQAFLFEQMSYRENKNKFLKLRLAKGNVPLTDLLDHFQGQNFNPPEQDFASSVLTQTAEVFMEGVDSIIDDNFWKCFQSNKPPPWNWNLYLWPLWLLGVIIRYFVLFPLRLIIFILGWILFALGTLLVQGLFPKGELRQSLEQGLISFQCGVFTLTWGAVIRFHGPQITQVDDMNCVFVANHSSMIDAIILQQNRCFSLVGQRHKGIVKFLQEVVLGSLQCIWFDRGEIKDRAIVAKRLTEHAKDKTRNPLLVFPEGTCVNNKYCIQFKKGVFELGVPIAPVAIKYNKMFVDPFWNSREQSFVMHLFELMTSWCLICDVWYLEPQTIRPNETSVEFAARVKKMISNAAGLIDVDWDGYMKYWKPSKRYRDSCQKRNAETLRAIYNEHTYVKEPEGSPYAPFYVKSGGSTPPVVEHFPKGNSMGLKQRNSHHLPSMVEE